MKKSDQTASAPVTAGESVYGPKMLRREEIRPDATQPRKVFAEGPLKELAASIADQGILQRLIVRLVPAPFTLREPDLTETQWVLVETATGVEQKFPQENNAILVGGGSENFKPHYQLIAGERRWRAAAIAGLDWVPCEVRKELTEGERFKIQHAENKDREGLSPLEEGESFARAIAEKLFTAEELAKELNMSRSHVYGRIKLAGLPEAVKAAVRSGQLNPALAELVARVPGEKLQLKAMKEIQEGGGYNYDEEDNDDVADDKPMEKLPMSVRNAKTHLKDKYMLDLANAVFDTKDGKLLGGVPSCQDCPLRTGNCKDLFPDIKSPNVCTDPACHAKKTAAFLDAKRRELVEDSGPEVRVLTERELKPFIKYGGIDPYHNLTVKSLTDEVPGDKKKRTYRELLGKDAPPIVAALTPKGKVEKFYPKADLQLALTKKGFSFKDPDAREREKETPEQKAEKEKLKRVREKIAKDERAAAVQKVTKLPEVDFLRMALVMSISYSQATDVCDRLGIKYKGDEPDMQEVVKKMTATDLRAFFVETELGRHDSGVDYQGNFSTKFVALCEGAGVDLAAKEALAMKALPAAKAAETKAAGKGKHGKKGK